jgi:hypothetical protein
MRISQGRTSPDAKFFKVITVSSPLYPACQYIQCQYHSCSSDDNDDTKSCQTFSSHRAPFVRVQKMAHEWTGEINLLRVRQEGNRMGYVQYNFVRKHHLDVRADLFPITSISEEGTWPDVSIVYEPRFSPQANQTQVGMVTLTCSHLIGLCANSLSKGDRNRPALSHGVRVSWIGFKY